MASDIHYAIMPLAFERSLDLGVRKQQGVGLQGVIGEFVASLLTNGEPLTFQISVQRGNADLGPMNQEKLLITVYWTEAELPEEVPVFKDWIFINRCLKCGNYLTGDHTCPSNPESSDQLPSPAPSPRDEEASEVEI